MVSAASLRRKEVESIPSKVSASTAVSEAPEPLNVVAVSVPVTVTPPDLVASFSEP